MVCIQEVRESQRRQEQRIVEVDLGVRQDCDFKLAQALQVIWWQELLIKRTATQRVVTLIFCLYQFKQSLVSRYTFEPGYCIIVVVLAFMYDCINKHCEIEMFVKFHRVTLKAHPRSVSFENMH